MSASRSIADELTQLAGMISRADGEIAAGGVVDLAPLEAKVREVCARIDRLPAEEAGEHRGTLVALLDELGGLERRIATGLKALAGELGQSSKRREAVSAYASRPGGNKP